MVSGWPRLPPARTCSDGTGPPPQGSPSTEGSLRAPFPSARESDRPLENREGLADLTLPAGLDRLGECADRAARFGLRCCLQHGLARVRRLAEGRVERDPREQRRVDLRRERLASPGAEELLAAPDEPGHVLDDAGDAHPELLGHH